MTLAELGPGMSAVITGVEAHDAGILKLMVLGLVEGAPIQFRNAAIGGDPIEVGVLGASISLRRDQARRFRIETG